MVRKMKKSNVVFMGAPKDKQLYLDYGATMTLWGGSSRENVRAAHDAGVYFQSSIWFLTAWGDVLAEDAKLQKAVCLDIEGKPIEVPWLIDHKQKMPNYWGCTNHPDYREHIRAKLITAMQGGPDGLHIDDHGGTSACCSLGLGCFCQYCVKGFQEYLQKKLPAEKWEELGIDNPKGFDYKSFVRKYTATRSEYGRMFGAHEIPLMDEFKIFQIRATADFVGELRGLTEKTAGKPISLSANTCINIPEQLGDFQHLDYLCGEIHLYTRAGKLSEISHFVYKVADGIDKPLAATGHGIDWAFIAEQNNPGMVKCWIAESYAFGHRLMVPHHQWCYTKENGTHWWDGKKEDFVPLYRFIRKHSELFDGYKSVAKIALVYNTQAFSRGDRTVLDIAGWLASSNIPYSLVIAGGEWIDLYLSEDKLSRFSSILIYNKDYLDGKQLAVLEKIRSRGKLVEWPDKEKIRYLAGSLIKVNNAENIWVLPQLVPGLSNKPIVIHLLNRNYNLENDSVEKVQNVEVYLNKSLFAGRSFKKGVFHNVQGEAEPFEVEDSGNDLCVTVPELDFWGIIQLSE